LLILSFTAFFFHFKTIFYVKVSNLIPESRRISTKRNSRQIRPEFSVKKLAEHVHVLIWKEDKYFAATKW